MTTLCHLRKFPPLLFFILLFFIPACSKNKSSSQESLAPKEMKQEAKLTLLGNLPSQVENSTFTFSHGVPEWIRVNASHNKSVFENEDKTLLVYHGPDGDKQFQPIPEEDPSKPSGERRVLMPLSYPPIVSVMPGEKIYFPAQKGKQQIVVVDGVEGKPYDEVSEPGSWGDGSSVAYIARTGKKYFLVVDGKEVGSYDEAEALSLSENIFVARVKKAGKWILIVNGKESKAFDQLSASTDFGLNFGPVLSPDGRTFLSTAQEGNHWYALINEKEEGPYEAVFLLMENSFSKDGSKYAYLARQNKNFILVVKGEQTPHTITSESFAFMSFPFKFSPHGESWAYPFEGENKEWMVVKGQEGPHFDKVGDFRFSEDGKTLVYAATDQGKQIVMKGDQKMELALSPVAKKVTTIDLSAPAPRAIEVFDKDGKRTISVDAKEDKAYDKLQLDPDGIANGALAYEALDGTDVLLVLNGKEIRPSQLFPGFRYERSEEEFPNFRLSKDGKLLAYQVKSIDRHNQSSIVLNGKKGGDYQSVQGLDFSLDGKHLIYVADLGGRASKPYRVVVDQMEGPAVDEVFFEDKDRRQKRFFFSEGKVSYVAQIGKQLFWVEQPTL